MTEAQSVKEVGSTQRVLDAVQELGRLEQVATRENVAELTNLTLTVVDDRLKVLTDDGKLKRLIRGVYVVAQTYPPARAISITEIPDGWVVIEIGDQKSVVTPKEARMLGRGLAGHVDDFRAGEAIRQSMYLASDVASSVQSLERRLQELQRHDRG